MKRVLHVMASLERSGMEQMLMSSAEAWQQAGFKCDVVATAESAGPVAEQMRSRGYEVFHLPFRSRHRLLPRTGFVRDFYQLCARPYDIVHIQVEAGRPLFALLARAAGVRRIAVTPHNTFRFTGTLRLRKMAERHLIRLMGGRFGMISEGVQECEWERFRIRGERIWNWIDTDHFRPPSEEERVRARLELGVSPEQFVVASVANCNRAKNHGALLEALSLMPEQERPVYVHVGREAPGAPERALAKQLGIAGTTRFAGSQPDVRTFLWAADAVAMPSLTEGLAISALEAVACGTPLVCSRIDGLKEIADKAPTTVLVTPEPTAIAEGLRTAIAAARGAGRQSALQDSARIRELFSMSNGVKSIVQGLYA